MARSFSNAKLLSSFVANAVSRRGYAVAASGGVARTGGARGGAILKKQVEEAVGNTEKVAWVPDPVTGFYRPENLAKEMDAAELRAMLLKSKTRAN